MPCALEYACPKDHGKAKYNLIHSSRVLRTCEAGGTSIHDKPSRAVAWLLCIGYAKAWTCADQTYATQACMRRSCGQAPHTPTSASQTILSDCSARSAALPPWASNTSGEYEVVVQVPFPVLFPQRGIRNGIRYYVAGPSDKPSILKYAEQQLYTRIEQTPIWDPRKPKARKRENFYFLYFRSF